MRVMYTSRAFGKAIEMGLGAALEPGGDEDLAAALGNLAALLVKKGVITLQEAADAMGVKGSIEEVR